MLLQQFDDTAATHKTTVQVNATHDIALFGFSLRVNHVISCCVGIIANVNTGGGVQAESSLVRDLVTVANSVLHLEAMRTRTPDAYNIDSGMVGLLDR